ncbi:MAG: EAL domain-containing protein [Baekduia sp.]
MLPASELPFGLSRFVRVCGLIAIGCGVVPLVGVVLGMPVLSEIVPGLPPTAPLSAVLLIGFGLVVMSKVTGGQVELLRRPLLAVLGLVAALVTAEYLAGVDLGIDRLLGGDHGGPHPGRPSLHSSVSFLLLAVALSTTRFRFDWRGLAAHIVTTTGAIVTGTAVVGHLLGAGAVRNLSSSAAMALPSAAGLIALYAAAYAFRPGYAPAVWWAQDGSGERAARRTAPLALVLPVAGGALVAAASALGWWDDRFSLALMVVGTAATALVLLRVVVRDVRANEQVVFEAERQSRAHLRRFGLLTTRSPVAIFETDAQGQCVFVNERWCEITGLTISSSLGAGWRSVLHPEDGGWVAAHLERPDRPLDFEGEYRIVRPDGEVRWLFGSASALVDDAGELSGYIGSVLDITDRRAAEEATARVVDRIAEAVAVRDADGSFLHQNEASEAIMADVTRRVTSWPGHRDEYRIIDESGELIAFDQLPGEKTRVTGEEIDDAILGFPEPGGETRWLRFSTRRLGGGPAPHQVILSFADITDRRRQELELAEARERFQRSFEDAPIGMALVGTDGRFQRVNRALCEMTGYDERRLTELGFQEITHPDDMADGDAALERLLAGGIETFHTEKRYVRADGEPIWVHLAVSPVRGDGGEARYFVTQVQDISDRKRHEHELQYLSDHDSLTGLANRRQLTADMTRRVAELDRHGQSFSLVLLDLDHFKYINDSLGHNVGDQVLCAVADALRGRLAATDLVARLGGDEFACVLARTDHDAAEGVAAELMDVVRTVTVQAGDRELHISASAGVVCATELAEPDADSMLAAADLAMYEAKEAGRDRYAVHDPSADGRHLASERLNWSHRIRQALDGEGFVLHYQAIVGLHEEGVPHYEALIRLADPALPSLALPGLFLPVAERYGLMPAVDRWVATEVIRALAEDEFHPKATIALNVSAYSLADSSLLDLVERLLDEAGVDPSRLCFEVTESIAISKLESAKAFGDRLRALGCAFALDDFGTGFGSFTHVKHLPYGIIKIDGDFIGGLATSTRDRAVVEALVHLARATGTLTVAECVGDGTTVELLRELGVDMAQGFYLGRPAPAAAVRAAEHELWPQAAARDRGAA